LAGFFLSLIQAFYVELSETIKLCRFQTDPLPIFQMAGNSGQFKSPHRGPGRPKGSKNRTPQALAQAFLNALDRAHPEGAEGYILRLAQDDPKTFTAALSKLLPRETGVTVRHETIEEAMKRLESCEGLPKIQTIKPNADGISEYVSCRAV
jgi:hypothetical protein